MDFFSDFFMMSISAIVVQNIFFTRAMGTNRMLMLMRKMKSAVLYGLLLTYVTTLSSLITWFMPMGSARSFYYKPIIYMLCISAVYTFTYLVLKRFGRRIFNDVEKMFPSVFFTCGALGALLLGSNVASSMGEYIGFGFGSGIGFMFALIIVDLGLRRIALSNIPKSFRGMPITLLYVGLISLAIYGLTGHQLPS